MAALYLKAAGGNWSAAATWSTTGSGGADNSGPPIASTDVVLQAGSGNCTIDAASVCRSIDASAYGAGKVLTHNAFTLTIGDGTAGAGNKALDFSGGFTYTLVSVTTSQITFASTSATVQTVNFGGKTTATVSYAGAGGSWQLTNGHTNAGITTGVFHSLGTLDTNGQTCSWGKFDGTATTTRTLTITNSAITLTGTTTCWNLVTTGLTAFNVSGSTLTFTGATSSFVGGGRTYNNVVFTNSGAQTITQSNNYTNLTVNGTAIKTGSLSLAGTQTCSSTFTCNGNSAINRILVFSSGVGTPRTITAAAISVDNTDFQDITGAGVATWNMSAGSVGNCGGNTMKALGDAAFTASATQTATGTSSFTWSTHGWTSRVPLPQDDVVINNSFDASQTITADMPRLGRSIDFTGATGTPEFTNGATVVSIYGSLTLISGMTIAGTGTINFCGRGNYTIFTDNKTTQTAYVFSAPNGTYTLLSSLTTSSGTTTTLTAGTLDLDIFNLTCQYMTVSGSITRSLYLGSGTLTFTTSSTNNIWNATTTTGLSFFAETSTIVINNTSANQKTFVGGGLTYNNLTITGRNVLITGSNTFNVLSDNTAGLAEGLYLTAGTTQTVNSFLTNGSAGSLARLRSSTSGLYGGGITLNGTNMAYSAVDHADFKPTGNFSVMAVFRTSQLAVGKTLFASYSQNTNFAGIALQITNANRITFFSARNTGIVSNTDYKSASSTASTYCDGAWHRVIVVYDGGHLHLYIDGTEDGTGTVWTNAAGFAATNYVRVGCQSNAGTNTQWFSGTLDEVALWNGTALSSADVTTLQSSQLADSAALLASSTVYYKFDIGAETTDTDAGAHTLTAIGVPAGTTPGKIAKPTKHNTIDYTDIADTTFQGGTKWYASTHSVDSAGNTGMTFTDAVPDGKGFWRLVR